MKKFLILTLIILLVTSNTNCLAYENFGYNNAPRNMYVFCEEHKASNNYEPVSVLARRIFYLHEYVEESSSSDDASCLSCCKH